jgi:hypothetical protein
MLQAGATILRQLSSNAMTALLWIFPVLHQRPSIDAMKLLKLVGSMLT